MTPTRDLARSLLGPAAVFAFAVVVHYDVLSFALLGWDTYATILASRIESGADLAGTFTELMMDGKLETGDFYRPVGNLSIAVDYALWGLEPFGYQLTHLLLFGACAAGIFAVARKLLEPGGGWLAPLVGAAFFVLHPLVLSVLPIVARRTELLAALFVLSALLVLPTRAADDCGPARPWAISVLAVLAFGSKESGLVVLPLLLVALWTTREDLEPAQRMRCAVRTLGPSALLCSVAFAVRMAVIGGLGGYDEPAAGSYLVRLFDGLQGYTSLLGMTSPWDTWRPAALLGTATVVGATALGLGAAWLGPASMRAEAQGSGPLMLVGATWLVLQVVVAANSVEFSPRYAFSALAGASLMLAAFVEAGRRLVEVGSGSARAVGLTLLVLAVTFAIGGLRGSPAWRDYSWLAEASRILHEELAALASELEKDPPEGPRRFSVQRQVVIRDRGVDNAWMLAPWSVQSWVDLAFPDLRLRVEFDNYKPRSPKYWHLVMEPAPERGGD